MTEQDQYEVGYAKPPKDSQWKPGQSGNPNGRPKKIKDVDKLTDRELSQTLRITESGQEVTLTKRELIIKRLVNNAIKGNSGAIKTVLSLMSNQQSITGFEPDAADRRAFEQLIQGSSKGDITEESEADHGSS